MIFHRHNQFLQLLLNNSFEQENRLVSVNHGSVHDPAFDRSIHLVKVNRLCEEKKRVLWDCYSDRYLREWGRYNYIAAGPLVDLVSAYGVNQALLERD